MRVRKSAIGSVCIFSPGSSNRAGLPARFRYAGNFAFERHPTETDSAHLELADVTARAAANAATIAHANLEFGLLERLGNFCGAGHLLRSSWNTQRETETLEQLAAFLVVSCRRGQRDVHAFDLVHAGVIDLRKYQLVFQAQRVVSAAVESVRGQAAKITYARQHHVAETVEKFVHLVAAQRDRAADGHAFANFEVRNGLLGLGDHGFLAGDLPELHRRGV